MNRAFTPKDAVGGVPGGSTQVTNPWPAKDQPIFIKVEVRRCLHQDFSKLLMKPLIPLVVLPCNTLLLQVPQNPKKQNPLNISLVMLGLSMRAMLSSNSQSSACLCAGIKICAPPCPATLKLFQLGRTSGRQGKALTNQSSIPRTCSEERTDF